MQIYLLISVSLFLTFSAFAQEPAQKIFETERAFEKMVAEKGINAGFIEYLAPTGVMFMPDRVNAVEAWKARPVSPALLTWNPILIDVASNGVLAYSIGNSMYRPNGKDDTTGLAGHYLSVWLRQPNGQYRAALDIGINHEKPLSSPAGGKFHSPTNETNPKRISAADSSTNFYQRAESDGIKDAYAAFLADDVIVMRDGSQPFVGKKAANIFFRAQKGIFKFAKLKSFTEAADLAYVHGKYSIGEKAGKSKETGNFVQIWKFRNGRWQIVADILVALPQTSK